MIRSVYHSPRLFYFLVALMLVMQLAGIIGIGAQPINQLISQYSPLNGFAELTPFNLLSVFTMLLVFQPDRKAPFWVFVVTCFLGGYVAELLGVHTGWLFGNYTYDTALGWKLAGVPLLIGLNWTLLVYASGKVVDGLVQPVWAKTALAAAIMVALDLFIEPVAMAFGFWSWENNSVPLQNYIGWYLVALPLIYAFYRLPFEKENPFAVWVLAGQFFFFIGVNLLWL